MLEGHAHSCEGGAIRTELVGDHDAGSAPLFANELAQKPFGRAFVTAALDQGVENKAFLIDGAPKPMLLAVDGDDDLVEMPFVAKSRRAAANFVDEVSTKFLRPSANRFVADDDATRGQKVFGHSQAERKAEIEPDSVGDQFGGKAMAAVEGVGRLGHHRQIPENRRQLLNVTVPAQSRLFAAGLDRCDSRAEPPKSIEFSDRFRGGDTPERVKIRACPCISAITQEVGRADVDQDDFPSALLPIHDLFRLEI